MESNDVEEEMMKELFLQRESPSRYCKSPAADNNRGGPNNVLGRRKELLRRLVGNSASVKWKISFFD